MTVKGFSDVATRQDREGFLRDTSRKARSDQPHVEGAHIAEYTPLYSDTGKRIKSLAGYLFDAR